MLLSEMPKVERLSKSAEAIGAGTPPTPSRIKSRLKDAIKRWSARMRRIACENFHTGSSEQNARSKKTIFS